MNEIRQATYALLARIFLAPPDADLLQSLAVLPPFDEVLRGVTLTPDVVEEHQVAYQNLFGFNFFPYESLFVDDDLMVNSAAAQRVAALMQRVGFDPAPYDMGAADHIGVELALMAHLIAQKESRHEATVVHQHLAQWVPVAMLTMQAIAATPLYALTAALTLELVLTDVEMLPATDALLWVSETPTPAAVPSDTTEKSESDEEGLNKIIRHLITPVACGLFLTRAEVRGMARQLNLPITLGDRFTMLKSLFETAGQFEQVEGLLDALEAYWRSAEGEIHVLLASAPAWSVGHLWLRRLEEGRTLLTTLRTTWQQRGDLLSEAE
jgi:TorA maturation chaperone TorD